MLRSIFKESDMSFISLALSKARIVPDFNLGISTSRTSISSSLAPTPGDDTDALYVQLSRRTAISPNTEKKQLEQVSKIADLRDKFKANLKELKQIVGDLKKAGTDLSTPGLSSDGKSALFTNAKSLVKAFNRIVSDPDFQAFAKVAEQAAQFVDSAHEDTKDNSKYLTLTKKPGQLGRGLTGSFLQSETISQIASKAHFLANIRLSLSDGGVAGGIQNDGVNNFNLDFSTPAGSTASLSKLNEIDSAISALQSLLGGDESRESTAREKKSLAIEVLPSQATLFDSVKDIAKVLAQNILANPKQAINAIGKPSNHVLL